MKIVDWLKLVLVAILLSYSFYVIVPAMRHVQLSNDIQALTEIKRDKQLAGLEVSLETKVIASMKREDTIATDKSLNAILKISIAGMATSLAFAWFRKFFSGKR